MFMRMPLFRLKKEQRHKLVVSHKFKFFLKGYVSFSGDFGLVLT
jgi:hypothetical protein